MTIYEQEEPAVEDEDFYDNDEGEQTGLDETDMFQDVALKSMPSFYTH